jgi:hypothetical protein
MSFFSNFFHEIVSALLIAFMAWHLRTPFLLADLNHAIKELNGWLARESKRIDSFERSQQVMQDTVHQHDKRISLLEFRGGR